MKTYHFWGNTWGKLELVLRRLEFLGLYSYLKVHFENRRRSSSFQGDSSIKRLAKLRTFSYVSVILLLFLTVDTIIPIYIEHTPVEAESGTATPSTLTFTSIKNSASVNLNVTSKDGTFATSSDNERAQFSISTNNYTGYTLKLRSIGSITTLNGDTTNINTISTTTTKTTFENTTSLNNHWGYIPSHYNSQVNNNNSYYPAPTNTNAATIMVTNSANGSTTHPATSDTYTIGLGLRADYTNPSGTYTNNTFILEYVANKVDFTLTYSKGTISDEVSNLPAVVYKADSIMGNPTESGNTSTYDVAHEIDLEYTDVPTRSGYDFVGWCDGSLENNGTECNGTPGKIYKDGEKYIVGENNSSVTLYAVWKEKPTVKLTFDANGGTFADGATTNVLKYSVPEVVHGTYTKNASYPVGRTDNTDSQSYGSNANNTQTVTISNATSLSVNLYYQTESNYDFVYVYEGASASGTQKARVSGGSKSSSTAYTITGDSVTFKFTSDGSSNYWGYWATVTGEGDEITQNLISGTYVEPTRTSALFLGWSTNPSATTPDYDLDAKVMSNTTIYAIWKIVTPFTDPTFKLNETNIANITYMQEMNSTICSNMTEETQYQLKDSRDGKYYYVAKLKDGKCWMTQNLDLDIDSSRVYESTNTNLAAGTSWSPVNDTIHITNDTVASWVNDYNIPYSVDRGNVYSASGSSSSLSSIDCTVTGKTNCHYHIGNHYNWTAALAMNDSSSVSTTSYTNPVSTSICPRGWRLPTTYGGNSSTNGEFKNLNVAYGNNTSNDNTLRASPLYFVRSGRVFIGSLGNVGSNGYCWSSTVRSSNVAYYLYFGSTYGGPATYDDRIFGASVRCVAQ